MRFKKGLYTVIAVILSVGLNMPTYGLAEELKKNEDCDILNLVDAMDQFYVFQPVTEISENGISAYFVYDDNGNRIEKDCADITTKFIYDNNIMYVEGKDTYSITYADDSFEHPISYTIDDYTIYYDYDTAGVIVSLSNEFGEVQCEFNYSESVYPQTVYMDSCSEYDIMVIEKNPILYCGYFYDSEIDMFYTGKGIFYDYRNNKMIQNEITFDEIGFMDYINNQGIMLSSSSTAFVNQVNAHAATILNRTATNELVSNVTLSQWQAGTRWYSGRDTTEIIARCIYSENASANRTNDRTAVAYVIGNHARSSKFPNTPYGVVTRYTAFSAMNPAYDSSGSISYGNAVTIPTAGARIAHSATNTAWRQSITLASILYYSTSQSDMATIYSKPSGINGQILFIAWTTGNSANITFNSSTGKFYYCGNEIKNLSIAGYGTFSNLSSLNSYKDQQYNLFFEYVNSNLY